MQNKAEKSHMISDISNAVHLTDIIQTVMKTPIVHVNRVDFLSKTFNIKEDEVRDKTYSISSDKRKRIAEQRITVNVVHSTTVSVLTGLPSSALTMAATIPADIIQNMGFSMRLIQELAYIYDYDDFVNEEGELQMDWAILFLGVMFGAQGAASLLRFAAPNVAKAAEKKVIATALTKTTWYPLTKKIFVTVTGKHLSKPILGKAASKAVPVVGGLASGVITAVTMEAGAKRLNKELLKGYGDNYTEAVFEADKRVIEGQFEEVE
ncbi:hypothetical protein [Lactovum odontotermitis]